MSCISLHSHSMLVPAESMIASAPQVTPVASLNATIGNVPPDERRFSLGGVVPVTVSSMPPVPNVILVLPGVIQPWPTREPCWSPTKLAIGGAPGNAVALPTTPDDLTIVGIISTSMPKMSRIRGDHDWFCSVHKPVTAALVSSVTKSWPLESTNATHVSTVPMQIFALDGIE